MRPPALIDHEMEERQSQPATLRFLRRNEAGAHVREKWGIPCSTAWLAKLATVGGGPIFRKAGRFPIYAASDLDAWARSRISAPVSSTSEFDVNKTVTQ
jgi:hypothetical protein